MLRQMVQRMPPRNQMVKRMVWQMPPPAARKTKNCNSELVTSGRIPSASNLWVDA